METMPPPKHWAAILLSTSLAWAAAPIGTVRPVGRLVLDGSPAAANAPFSSGSSFEASEAGTRLSLGNGVKIQLGGDTKIQIWEDHLSLTRGHVEVTGAFRIDAGGYQVHVMEAGRTTVDLKDRMSATSASGVARVTNLDGRVLSFLPSGQSVSYSKELSKTLIEHRVGCLLAKDSRFVLLDDANGDLVSLQGPDLELNLGNRAEVTGTFESAGKGLVLKVVSVSPKSQGGCLSAAAELGASVRAAKPKP